MGNIKITIEPRHFRDARRYLSNDCPLGLVLKERFPGSEIMVGGADVHIGDRIYKIPHVEKWGAGHYPAQEIDDLIRLAKTSLENIPTVEFELVPYE